MAKRVTARTYKTNRFAKPESLIGSNVNTVYNFPTPLLLEAWELV
jgi:hypothetical protein